MTMELYSWPRSSGTRVTWALEELGLPYRYNELDRAKQENLAPQFRAINPHGKIPALVDEGVRVFESAAILIYLGDKHGAAKGLWPAAGSQSHVDALGWTVWGAGDLMTCVLQVLYHGLDTPVSFRPEDRSKAAADYFRSQLERQLETLDRQAAEREFLLGPFSLADIGAASALAFGSSLGLDLAGHDAALAWCKRCTARPAFKRAR